MALHVWKISARMWRRAAKRTSTRISSIRAREWRRRGLLDFSRYDEQTAAAKGFSVRPEG
jgi:hypothetical protein